MSKNGAIKQRAMSRVAKLVFILAAPLFSITGCATERYMTEEQDAQMRATCEKTGCAVVPAPVWEQIKALLKTLGLSNKGGTI